MSLASQPNTGARFSTICVLSDVHYAGPLEKQRGATELNVINASWLRAFVRAYRHFLWRRDPIAHNYLLDDFIAAAGKPDYVIANGDYSCDTAFIGVADDAACESARECLGKLSTAFGPRFLATFGDHELGKLSLFGGVGGMRLASWRRAQSELGLRPLSAVDLGAYTLLGVTSSLIALPVFQHDALPEEYDEWSRLRQEHLQSLQNLFERLTPDRRIILFCHDPTALPFLWEMEAIRKRLSQIETTVIGHLHSALFLWKSRMLAGIPPIRFLGHSIQRMSTALNNARLWKRFSVRLCPSLAGIQLLKDGGFCRITLDQGGQQPLQWETVRLPWRR